LQKKLKSLGDNKPQVQARCLAFMSAKNARDMALKNAKATHDKALSLENDCNAKALI